MKKSNIQNIIIIILILTLVGIFVFRPFEREKLVEVEKIVTVAKEYRQSMLDSLARIPIIEARVVELETDYARLGQSYNAIQVELAEVTAEIEEMTVEEDMQYWAESIDADTMPQLVSVNNSIWVAIVPEYLKRTNHIFAKYHAQVKSIANLEGQVDNLEEQKQELEKQVTTLTGAVTQADNAYLELEKAVDLQDEQIEQLIKKTRWQKVGIFGGIAIGIGVGALLFIN